MRISRIELRNYKRVFNGLGKKEVIIEVPSSRIVRIVGTNGSGKSTIMRYLTPLSDGVSEIMEGEDGQKVIDIEDGEDLYVITYRYKACILNGKQNHNSSCSIIRNGEELNVNGNISSGKELIMNMFGMDNNFDVLSRLTAYDGRSLADMRPANRKAFIGNLLNNIDVYNNIYKTLSKRSSIFKSVTNSLGEKIGRLGDPGSINMAYSNSKINLMELNKRRDEIIGIMNNSSIEKLNYEYRTVLLPKLSNLMSKRDKISVELSNFEDIIEGNRKKVGKCDDVYDLVNNDNDLLELDDMIEMHTSSYNLGNEYLIKAKSNLDNLESNHGANMTKLTTLKSKLDLQTKSYNSFIESEDLLKSKKKELDSLEETFTFSSTIDFNELKEVAKRIDEAKNTFSLNVSNSRILDENGNLDRDKIWKIIDKSFESGISDMITISNIIRDLIDYADNKDKISEFAILSNTLKDRLKENYEFITAKENEGKSTLDMISELHNYYDEYNYISHLTNDIIAINDKLQILREANVDSVYNSMKKEVDNLIEVMEKEKCDICDTKKFICELEDKQSRESTTIVLLKEIKEALIEYDRYKPEYNRTIEDINTISDKISGLKDTISKWESMSKELEQIDASIKREETILYSYKHSLDLLNEYMKEMEDYNSKYAKIEILKKYSSPSTGIQVAFVELYMNKILSMANQLLSSLFEGQFVINKFEINENEFRIPVQGNGLPIDDISSLSASQLAMANMCISFALLHHSSTKFKILRLDEIDSSLDQINRLAYPTIINTIMDIMNSEQCFVISHNIEFDNSECDIIDLNKL